MIILVNGKLSVYNGDADALQNHLRETSMVLVAKKNAKDDVGSLVMTFRCDSDLHRALNKFQNEQRIKPSKAEILIVALQEFLQREGYYSGDESDD